MVALHWGGEKGVSGGTQSTPYQYLAQTPENACHGFLLRLVRCKKREHEAARYQTDVRSYPGGGGGVTVCLCDYVA